MGLIVFLGDLRVGRLAYDNVRKIVSFRFDQTYIDLAERPVLSRYFEDFELSAGVEFIGEGANPPNYFRNCLPEGALRKLVEDEVPQWYFREYHLLERLGEDLPGNVRLLDDKIEIDADELLSSVKEPPPPGSTRFSLAGLQLKLSVLVEEDIHITIPVSGIGGKHIAKLPSQACIDLPENEFLMLQWASESGVIAPEHRLIKVAQIINIPKDYKAAGENALLIKRFDRDGDTRIHQEDFAQVFGLAPGQKYAAEVPDDVHYGSIGATILRICGEDDFYEYIKRIVFMLLSGNADAHLKNWSLYYPNGRNPKLSPVYDIVSTEVYHPNISRHLALSLSGEVNPYEIEYDHFHKLAEFCGVNATKLVSFVKHFSTLARSNWDTLKENTSFPQSVRNAVTIHLNRLQI